MSKERLLKIFWTCLITVGVVLTRNHAFRANTRTIIGKYVCESDVMHLECHASTVLEIQAADYGGSAAFICGNNEDSNQPCALTDKTDLIKKRCDNRPACSIPAISPIFGDPCPGLNKYLNVLYACVPAVKWRKSTTITPATPKTDNQTEPPTEIATPVPTSTSSEANSTVNPNATANGTQPMSTESTLTTAEPKKRTTSSTKKGVVTPKVIPVFDPAKSVEIEALPNTGTSKIVLNEVCLAWAWVASLILIC